jgi:hypothetical protein
VQLYSGFASLLRMPLSDSGIALKSISVNDSGMPERNITGIAAYCWLLLWLLASIMMNPNLPLFAELTL